jgi:NTE family protein
MERINKSAMLEQVPLFAGLPARDKALIRERSDIVEYKKDQLIYQEGQPPSNFYCIIVGRVLIHTVEPGGYVKTLEYLHRGKYFGIISLLTGEPHSVTARAINDCLLLSISRANFDFLLKKIPALGIDLSQTLSRRLKNKDVHPKTIFESTVLSVFSSYSQAGKTLYALNLALSLHTETRKSVLILDICGKESTHSLPRRLGMGDNYPVLDLSSDFTHPGKMIERTLLKDPAGIDLVCLKYKREDDACVRRLVEIISHIVNDYHYIVLDLPSEMDTFVFEVLNQSDAIHILTSPEAVYLKRTHHLIKRLIADFHFPQTKIKIIVNEYKLSRISYPQQAQILDYEIFATLPRIEFTAVDRLVLERPQSEYAKVIRRIARQAGDCLVGLALGVGVAYGFCHIGVLKVIEEENIPVDVISGSSIGALVASLWATGRSSREILELTREFKEQKHIWNMIDLTVPFLGFIKGNKLHNFLKRHLGNKTFYDVKLPLKIVASDIRRKESRVMERGSLVDAIMASCAMPGVFQPFKAREEMLLDGGMISPLPTEPLFSMGIKKIIAVNVTPSREDILRQYEKMNGKIAAPFEAAGKGGGFSVKRYLAGKFRTNILEIIFSSVELMQSELAQKESQLADVVLHPDVSGLHWLELHRAPEFARIGEEEARRNLDKIRQVINE